MMHRLLATLVAFAALAAPTLCQDITSVSIPSVSGCGAVALTREICNTCVTLACIVEATITAGCDGCPAPPPTIYRSFPCDQGCGGLGGCQTTYRVVTPPDGVCETALLPTLTTSPSSLPSSTAGGDGSSSDAGGAGTGAGTATQTVTSTHTQDAGEVGDETRTVTTATSVSTAGAARRMPLRLW
ncbi:hypothetical protein N658DRAFT_527903 [Parathielavia hyrcaniae]|uniref:Uncharacterized protein n=1 Tax=Parathielavia hyrcaniae TaxID=113614 RepID=A0AAN6PQS4_9PEZI|nr:hypothetical protein N658DRAFT_527903 [Parathielavia hyrcaniae]